VKTIRSKSRELKDDVDRTGEGALMHFGRLIGHKKETASSYRCDPEALRRMGQDQDLKAAELEAIGWLGREDVGEAADAISGFLSPKLVPGFIERVRKYDRAAAAYLDVALRRE
jgi:hypothetical protein